MSSKDFLITDVTIESKQLDYVPNSSYNYGGFQRPVFNYTIVNYNDIQPFILKRKNDRFREPFIFFGKKVYGTLIEGENLIYSNEPSMHYEYVAFNEGQFLKTAKFKQFIVRGYSFPDVDISEIPKEALRELREFIIKQRTHEYPTFCNTILTEVERVL